MGHISKRKIHILPAMIVEDMLRNNKNLGKVSHKPIISILGNERKDFPILNSKISNNKFLKLSFDDIDCKIDAKYILVNENDILEIIKFIEALKDNTENIIVHCHAGVSRSSAVAMIVAFILTKDFEYAKSIVDIAKYHSPNELVLHIADKILGTNFEKYVIEEKERTKVEWLKNKFNI